MIKTIEKYGNYEVVEYDKMTTIDFNNENVGLTVKVFATTEEALKVFSKTIKTLTPAKAKKYNDDTRKLVIYNS